MIIVNLKGGLGNQMFQYALGRALSLRNQDTLQLDTTTLDHANQIGNVYRPFALSDFTIQHTTATEHEVHSIRYPHGSLSTLTELLQQKLLRQFHIGWEPKTLEKTGDMYLDGYWQSPKYFKNIRETLLRDFTLHSPSSDFHTWENVIRSAPSVSLHIRRGDYISNSRVAKDMGTCSLNYYKAAVAQVSQETGVRFYIFSDDIFWAKEQFDSFPNTVFVSSDTLTAAEELILMSRCSHNIIANSTFSWWSAWLNQNPEKVVIAPYPWSNTHRAAYKDLLPNSWQTIPRQ